MEDAKLLGGLKTMLKQKHPKNALKVQFKAVLQPEKQINKT